MSITSQLQAAYDESKAAYSIRRARIEAAYKESNSGIEPTKDRNGRFHAPCDGYVMPVGIMDNYRGDYENHVFGAGEYLPVPFNEEDEYFSPSVSFSFSYKRKVKAYIEDIKEMAASALSVGITADHGKVWQENGKEVAYAYVAGLKSVVDKACEIIAIPVTGKMWTPTSAEPEVYAEAGRYEVTGELVHVKAEEGFYGMQYKMLVKTPNGCKLWGKLPSSLDSVFRGNITFTATFEPGKNGLSYFKRPSKVKVND